MSAKSPERAHSCARSCAAARRHARPIPARQQIPIAALLSARTSRGAANPRSWATATSPSPSAAPLATPANSASPDLKAMVFCAVDQRVTAHNPRAHAPPRVDRLAAHPAKSASTYARRMAPSPCHGKR
eukprot:11653315-Alexandrium_andersonii.AAC.1